MKLFRFSHSRGSELIQVNATISRFDNNVSSLVLGKAPPRWGTSGRAKRSLSLAHVDPLCN
jgi:hypothetical protein